MPYFTSVLIIEHKKKKKSDLEGERQTARVIYKIKISKLCFMDRLISNRSGFQINCMAM